MLHDAFAYVEARFGLTAPMAVTDGHAVPPGPGRLARLRAALEAAPVACAFTEPDAPRALLDRVLEGQATRVVALDVMGPQDGPLAGRYPALLETMAETMLDCLQQ